MVSGQRVGREDVGVTLRHFGEAGWVGLSLDADENQAIAWQGPFDFIAPLAHGTMALTRFYLARQLYGLDPAD